MPCICRDLTRERAVPGTCQNYLLLLTSMGYLQIAGGPFIICSEMVTHSIQIKVFSFHLSGFCLE